MEVNRKIAHKYSTIEYKADKDKFCGIPAKKFLELVKKSHGIIIPARKFQLVVAEVTAGMSPSKRGNPDSTLDFTFQTY